MSVRLRRCLRCDVDLSDVMGVHVFISAPPPREVETTEYLFCLKHGNGTNVVKREEFFQLVAMANTREEMRAQQRHRYTAPTGAPWCTSTEAQPQGWACGRQAEHPIHNLDVEAR